MMYDASPPVASAWRYIEQSKLRIYLPGWIYALDSTDGCRDEIAPRTYVKAGVIRRLMSYVAPAAPATGRSPNRA